MYLFQGCPLGMSLFKSVIISGCPYLRGVLISGVSLFQGCSYFRGTFISRVPLSSQAHSNVHVGVATFCRGAATPVSAEEGLTGVLTQPTLEDAVGHHTPTIHSPFSQEEVSRTY